jgi:hypothetical protein
MFTETITAGRSPLSFTFCSDAAGLTADQISVLKMTCATHPGSSDAGFTLSGTYSDSGCPSANRIGGSTVSSGSYTQTSWYYAGNGITVDLVQMVCQQLSGKFVPS